MEAGKSQDLKLLVSDYSNNLLSSHTTQIHQAPNDKTKLKMTPLKAQKFTEKKKDRENNSSVSLFIFPSQESRKPTLILEAYLTLESIFIKTYLIILHGGAKTR